MDDKAFALLFPSFFVVLLRSVRECVKPSKGKKKNGRVIRKSQTSEGAGETKTKAALLRPSLFFSSPNGRKADDDDDEQERRKTLLFRLSQRRPNLS